MLFSELNSVQQSNPLPQVLLGDSNRMRFSTDCKGATNTWKTSNLFISLVNPHSLMKKGLSNWYFTWSNFREEASLAGLDHCFVSLEWLNKFPLVVLTTLVQTTSDHIPLLLQHIFHAQGKLPLNKPFRFENFWRSHAGFDDTVRAWWEEGPTSFDAATNLVLKLRFLRSKLKH